MIQQRPHRNVTGLLDVKTKHFLRPVSGPAGHWALDNGKELRAEPGDEDIGLSRACELSAHLI
jgi:hypothetical protein